MDVLVNRDGTLGDAERSEREQGRRVTTEWQCDQASLSRLATGSRYQALPRPSRIPAPQMPKGAERRTDRMTRRGPGELRGQNDSNIGDCEMLERN